MTTFLRRRLWPAVALLLALTLSPASPTRWS